MNYVHLFYICIIFSLSHKRTRETTISDGKCNDSDDDSEEEGQEKEIDLQSNANSANVLSQKRKGNSAVGKIIYIFLEYRMGDNLS